MNKKELARLKREKALLEKMYPEVDAYKIPDPYALPKKSLYEELGTTDKPKKPRRKK